MRLSFNSKNNALKKEEIEKRILERFSNLNDDQQYHNLFCSYDFHENEKNMLEFWKDVIEFLFESVKNTHGMKHEDIIETIKIKGKKPLGLSNITQKLIEDGDLIPSSMLSNDLYYKKYFPELVKTNETWGGWMKRNISRYSFIII
jgi:hypothetical protein